MSKKQEVKYRIIPDTLMKDLVEFIDEMQFEASKLNTTENHHLLNLCNYLISCLINSDSFTEDVGGKKSDEEYWQSSPSSDFLSYDVGDMTEEEYERLLTAFDSFMYGYKKESKRKSHKDKGNKTPLKKFASDLRRDVDLTREEKFDLYYDEYLKRKDDSESLDSILSNLGIKKPKKK